MTQIHMTQIQQTARLQNAEQMPAIMVSEADYDRLVSLAVAVEDRAPDVASVLQSEMKRAQVVPAEAFPAHVVQMGSTVEFRADSGQQRRVTLVFPGEADFAQGRISILTPIGAALIGLSPGQSIAWTARDGRRHRLTVLSVAQPDAEPAGSTRNGG
jgi:regulator of nucleoside diphosphate kinase